MRDEILMLRANLAAQKEKLKELLMQADNSLTTLRAKSNPYLGEDLIELESEKCLLAAKEVHRILEEAREVKAKIKRMERDLG